MEDMNALRAQFESGTLSRGAAREKAEELRLPERFEANACGGEMTHILSYDEIKQNIRESSANILLRTFGINHGDVLASLQFPHDSNALDRKLFVNLPDGRFYFLDPG